MSIKECDVVFVKKTLFLTAISAAPIGLLIVVISLFFDVVWYDTLLGVCIPLVCVMLAGLYVGLRLIWERSLIQKQRDRYGLSIQIDNAERINAGSMVFLNDDCLIWSGRLVLHRAFISDIAVFCRARSKPQDGYSCQCRCVNGHTYCVFVPSADEAREIKKWHKMATTHSKAVE